MNRHFLPVIGVMLMAVPVAAAPVRDARFDAFFAGFRKAVLSSDSRAVARMTHFPFTDYRAGHYCEPSDTACTVAPDSVTSTDEAVFLRNYDRIFTPPVVAAIRSGRVRAFAAGRDDGDVPGPIGPGEFLLDTPEADHQRVFARHGGSWKLDRIPFQS